MPRTEQANQQIRKEQRVKILEAARKVFARKGLAATMDDVAAEAHISHGLAYRYFASKEAMVRTLIEEALQARSAGLDQIQEAPGTPGERLVHVVSEFIESRRHAEFFLLLDRVLQDDTMPGDFRVLIQKRSRALGSTLRKLIVEGQRTGEVAVGDPDQLVRAVMASVDGLTRWTAHDPGQDDEHFPEPAIFLRMLKPNPKENTH